MHYDFEHVALDLPHVVGDETNYVFDSREIGENLSITTEPSEPKLTPEMVLEAITRPLDQGMGPLTVVAEGDAVFLGQPARQAEYKLGPSGEQLLLFFLVRMDPQTTTIIRWMVGAPKGDEGARFAHMIGSARPAQDPWSRTGSTGYTRRQTGLFTLEIPWQLGSPSSYSFAARDNSMRLTLEYLNEPAAEGPPNFEEFISSENDDEAWRPSSDEQRPLVNTEFSGWSGRYAFAGFVGATQTRERVLRQLTVAVAKGLTWRVVGLATDAGVRTLDAIWPQLEATLVRGK